MPFVLGVLVEGPLLLYCERFRRERVLGLGLLGMGVSLSGCAWATNLVEFGLAFALYYPSSGIACGIAQAALMDADPERREQRMTEWAFSGWVGDLAGPVLLWLAEQLHLEFRSAFAAIGALLFVAAAAFSRRQLTAGGPDDDESEPALPLADTVRLLVRKRPLFLWLLAVAFCSLLDEIVAALIGLRVAPQGGAAAVALSLSAFTLGGILGLLPMNWLLARMPGTRVLALACWGCGVSYTAWLVLPSSWSAPLLFVVGAFTAAHYPLAQAQAYRALPDRSTLVAAAAQPFTVFDALLPLLVGWVADEWGVLWALAVLGAQPLGVLAACWFEKNRKAAPL